MIDRSDSYFNLFTAIHCNFSFTALSLVHCVISSVWFLVYWWVDNKWYCDFARPIKLKTPLRFNWIATPFDLIRFVCQNNFGNVWLVKRMARKVFTFQVQDRMNFVEFSAFAFVLSKQRTKAKERKKHEERFPSSESASNNKSSQSLLLYGMHNTQNHNTQSCSMEMVAFAFCACRLI